MPDPMQDGLSIQRTCQLPRQADFVGEGRHDAVGGASGVDDSLLHAGSPTLAQEGCILCPKRGGAPRRGTLNPVIELDLKAHAFKAIFSSGDNQRGGATRSDDTPRKVRQIPRYGGCIHKCINRLSV